MRSIARSLVALLLTAVFAAEACSSNLSASTPAPPPAANPPTEAAVQPSTAPEESRGMPRWAWWTIAGGLAVSAIVLVFYYVIVPGAAENAGRAAANVDSGGDGNGGLLPLGS
ncbi:MAG: hypothetical protein ACREQQ_09010 [Candidatus Binatia bacterium]